MTDIFGKSTVKLDLDKVAELLNNAEVRSPDTAVIVEVVEPPPEPAGLEVDVDEDEDYEPAV